MQRIGGFITESLPLVDPWGTDKSHPPAYSLLLRLYRGDLKNREVFFVVVINTTVFNSLCS